MTITLRRADVADSATLAALGRATFIETFVQKFNMPYAPADVEDFFASAYTAERVAQSMATPAVTWWLAERDGAAAAFAMTGPCQLPHAAVSAENGELKRLYVLDAHQGFGLGRALLEGCLERLESAFAGPIWLGVWSGNEKAQRMYEKYGFVKAGDMEFAVGAVRDHEFLFRRDERGLGPR